MMERQQVAMRETNVHTS